MSPEGDDPIPHLPWSFGRFQLLELIGRGGYGVVFRAYDPTLAREVAIKMPRPDLTGVASLRQRFLFEGRATAVLDHPNVVPVYEAGEIGDVCYLTAAYCPGETLARWLSLQSELVPVRQAVRLVAAIADGVAHAHSRGILHRDLKPGNVLLSPGVESPRVTDFGLARLTVTPDDGATLPGQVLGTPGYMAPEQAVGDNLRVGTHTDVYALGVILYELLTGCRPFAGSDVSETQRVLTEERIPVPRRGRKRLPGDLEAICIKCLEKDPARRYPTARELADDLRRVLANEPTVARPPGGRARLTNWCRRRPAIATLAAASVAAAGVVTGVIGQSAYELRRTNDALRVALDDAKEKDRLAARRAAETHRLSYATQLRIAGQLWQQQQYAVMQDVLQGLTPTAGGPDHRDFAWRLLWRQARNELVLRGHTKTVRGVAFSPATGGLCSVAEDATIRVWNPDDGTPVREIPTAGSGTPCGMAVPADGKHVAVVFRTKDGGHRIRVWPIDANTPVGEIGYATHSDRSVVAAVGQDRLAVSRKPAPGSPAGALLLWNWVSGRQEYLLPDSGECSAIAVSADGKQVAAACHVTGTDDSVVNVLDVASGRTVTQLPVVRGVVCTLAFSPDGKSLVGGGAPETFVVWDLTTGTVRTRATVPQEGTQSVLFADGGRCLVSLASFDDSTTHTRMRVREARTGQELFPSAEFPSNSDILAVDPSGTRCALSDGQTIRVRRLVPKSPSTPLPGHEKETWGAVFSPDCRTLLTSSDDATVAVWDVASRTRLRVFAEHPSLVSCVAVSPAGEWAVSGDYEGGLKIWDTRTARAVTTLAGHPSMVRGVAVSPDGRRIASVGRDGNTCLWDARSGQQLDLSGDHTPDVRGVTFTRDGRHLVTVGNDQTLVVRGLDTAKVTRFTTTEELTAVATVPDGPSVVTGGKDGVPRVWDLATGRKRSFTGGHSKSITAVAVSPDGLTLATGSLDKTVRLWHLPTGVEVCTLGPFSDRVHAVAFSPDGATLAVGVMDGGVHLWSGADDPPPR